MIGKAPRGRKGLAAPRHRAAAWQTGGFPGKFISIPLPTRMRNTTVSDLTRLPLSRRDVLKLAAAGVAATATGLPTAKAAADATDPYDGLKMGMQSFSLRGYDFPTALRHTRELGLKYWESTPQHIPLSITRQNIEGSKRKLKDAGILLMSYGVLEFNSNETDARQKFDFAKAMGLVAISANPRKDKRTFDLLDKLVPEYDVAIAIHNHGPHARYDKISDVADAIKDHHPKIGACSTRGTISAAMRIPTRRWSASRTAFTECTSRTCGRSRPGAAARRFLQLSARVTSTS